MEGLDLFPANGLDKSILTPVLVGVALLTLAAETLGWSYTGLVVPGYLAALFSTAPVTGATVCVESAMAYALARGIGVHLPAVDAWSTFFGRERFFLVIAASMLVRLFAEGVALPALARHYDFAHASELYSIGLVLIPLVANSAWNIGLTRGIAQNAVIGALTYLVLQTVLLPFTNLSLSRVELSYESVALDFMAAPKAYLVLLAGTLLGARANVRYGWDFHGILVPGLLAVAWYSPSKLLATFVEAVLVAVTARGVVKLPGFRRRLIEGPRRTFLAFCIGFSLKWLLGSTMLGLFPGQRATDLYGFGYVLPTLLALKIWQYGSVPRVLMPTLQVSILGFVLGNLAGLALATAWPAPEPARSAAPRVVEGRSLALELTLQAALPLNARPRAIEDEQLEALSAFALAASQGRAGSVVGRCAAAGLEVVVVQDAELGPVWLLRDDRSLRYTPAFAVRARGRGGMVVRGADPLRMVTAALATAAALKLRWWLLLPDGVDADEDWREEVVRRMPFGGVRELTVGAEALALEPLVRGDTNLLRRNALAWRVGGSQARLRGPGVEELDAWVWGAAELDPPLEWGTLERSFAADSWRLDVGRRLRRRAVRAFTAHVMAPLLAWADGGAELSLSQRGLMRAMGFRLHRLDDLPGDALVLHRPAPETPGEALLWVLRRQPARLAVAVPHNPPEGAEGAAGRALALAGGARHLLLGNLAGKHPQAPADTTVVRRSYYQRALEALLARGAAILSVRRAPLQQGNVQADVVLTKARGVAKPTSQPPGYARDALELLTRAGLSHAWYNGDQLTFRFRGSGDPLLDYARKLYPERVLGLWLSDAARARFSTRIPARERRWLRRLGLTPLPGDVVEALFERPGASEPSQTEADEPATCDPEAALVIFDRLRATRNPALLQPLLDLKGRCQLRAVRDLESGRSFLVVRGAARSAATLLGSPGARLIQQVADRAAARDALRVGSTDLRVGGAGAP